MAEFNPLQVMPASPGWEAICADLERGRVVRLRVVAWALCDVGGHELTGASLGEGEPDEQWKADPSQPRRMVGLVREPWGAIGVAEDGQAPDPIFCGYADTEAENLQDSTAYLDAKAVLRRHAKRVAAAATATRPAT